MNLMYKDEKSMAKHLSDLQDLMNQFSVLKSVLDKELQAILFLGLY